LWGEPSGDAALVAAQDVPGLPPSERGYERQLKDFIHIYASWKFDWLDVPDLIRRSGARCTGTEGGWRAATFRQVPGPACAGSL